MTIARWSIPQEVALKMRVKLEELSKKSSGFMNISLEDFAAYQAEYRALLERYEQERRAKNQES